jgi:hypothetical protein
VFKAFGGVPGSRCRLGQSRVATHYTEEMS